MHYDVVEAQVIGELSFTVRFADGLSGTVRFLPSYLYGVFEKLKNPDFFNHAAAWGKLALCCITFDGVRAGMLALLIFAICSNANNPAILRCICRKSPPEL